MVNNEHFVTAFAALGVAPYVLVILKALKPRIKGNIKWEGTMKLG